MIIAQRILKFVAGPHAGKTVRISVHLPKQDGNGWSCGYDIDWPDRSRQSEAAGIDAIQALNIAMQKVGVELYTSQHHAQRSIEFEGPGKGYGFPVPRSMRDVLIGDDKLFDGQ